MPPAQRNRRAIENAHHVSCDIRQELFVKTVNLSGSQFDSFGLPSLISRMTSDSCNVQSAVQQFQTLCVRAPMLLIGGVGIALIMDAPLAMILAAILPVLILDEAASNVDTNTERQVRKAIRSLMAGKTCFVIAHRLSTIQNADRVLVADHGDVAEQGTHRELMERQGFYDRQYASQFG